MKKSVWIALALMAFLGSVGSLFLLRSFAQVTEQTENAPVPENPAELPVGKSAGEKTGGTPGGAESANEDAKTAENALENAIGLAIKGISLFQGEGGVELWRLKASWAHMSEEGGIIDVDSPVVRYTLGDPKLEDYMDVLAQKGRITDNQRHLDLWGDVMVTRAEQKVTGPRLKYDAATRIMVFPEGADLDGPAASGTAAHFSWNLGDNVMTGDGGVTVVLKARPAAETAPEDPGAGAGPAVAPAEKSAPGVSSSVPAETGSKTATADKAKQKPASL